MLSKTFWSKSPDTQLILSIFSLITCLSKSSIQRYLNEEKIISELFNVGKSTILSRVTKATPKIADYHFTTIDPNLGVVKTEYGDSFVLADIPGIIEGASEGIGLGTQF